MWLSGTALAVTLDCIGLYDLFIYSKTNEFIFNDGLWEQFH